MGLASNRHFATIICEQLPQMVPGGACQFRASGLVCVWFQGNTLSVLFSHSLSTWVRLPTRSRTNEELTWVDISLFLPRHRSCRSFKSFELFFRGAKFAEPFTEILQSIYFRLTLEDLTLQACRVSRPCFKNQMVVCTICMCIYI